MNLFKKIRRRLAAIMQRDKKWQDNEYFDAKWQERIRQLASLRRDDEHSVLDLGCGMEWLRQYLPPEITYYPVDYTARSADTIVCDFNNGDFPEVKADVTFISGCLEYIDDYPAFLQKVRSSCKALIISYCSTELVPDRDKRTLLCWKNHLTRTQLDEALRAAGFTPVSELPAYRKNLIMRWE